ncbi:adenylate/guanylate cyclase domain-containing protein [Ruegeria sp. HKCCA0370]|uniref:adenylate/guanylate cyclase domain-containing protein n=1 Tax=Ruegeria sp. HKCCA0370 TaxID=2682995 RepID=UPI0014876608|nr:adenylate/guanylate cyclase domain-containing protein [Ruegeria sp. HKCCA0370]
MIRSSPELLAVSRRWYEILRTKKNTEELRNFLSKAEELRFVGTGEGEYWSGQAVRDGVSGFFAEIPAPVVFEEIEAEAFENGETGWSSFVHKIQFVGFDEAVFYRTVLIFVLEGAAWKIINRHASVPTPNIELVGKEQLAIQKLIDAARDEGPELTQTEGLASVLFTDVEGSTALAEALGDQRWSVLIENHFRVLSAIIEKHHGQFVKSLGDGTLSVFPSAKEALAAAVKIQKAIASVSEEPFFGIRIGIHTGDVVQSRGDFFGTVVNKASRITTAGVAGEILVSDVTRAMVAGQTGFSFSGLEPRLLKGLRGHHVLYRLQWNN